jgi:uncharacterized protein
MIWGILGGLAGAYILCLILLVLAQRSIIFAPNQEPADLSLALAPDGMREIAVTSADGLDLKSWYLPPARADFPVIVYFHGNAGHRGGRVERIWPYALAGYGVLLVGYRGYGGNPGQPNEIGLYADAEANLDFLEKEGIGRDRMILFGESLGAAVAVEMATRHQARGLVLEAPFCSILLSARKRYPLFAIDAIILDKFDSLGKIGRVHMPLLVVHGEQDGTTPVIFGKRLFAAANEPKRGLFPQAAGHNDLMSHGMPEAVLDFLAGLRK